MATTFPLAALPLVALNSSLDSQASGLRPIPLEPFFRRAGIPKMLVNMCLYLVMNRVIDQSPSTFKTLMAGDDRTQAENGSIRPSGALRTGPLLHWFLLHRLLLYRTLPYWPLLKCDVWKQPRSPRSRQGDPLSEGVERFRGGSEDSERSSETSQHPPTMLISAGSRSPESGRIPDSCAVLSPTTMSASSAVSSTASPPDP